MGAYDSNPELIRNALSNQVIFHPLSSLLSLSVDQAHLLISRFGKLVSEEAYALCIKSLKSSLSCERMCSYGVIFHVTVETS